LIAGLCAAGSYVIDIGVEPTPLLYFATHHFRTRSGVMLTGSHNSPEYNGLKIVLDGETLSNDSIQAIYRRILDDDMVSGQGMLRELSVSENYLHVIKQDAEAHATNKKFKIVVDCGNGVTGHLAPKLYRDLGHEVIELFCELDGNFPNHHPDPCEPQNLKALIAMVKEEQADVGIAFDGDGDRLGVVDGQGNIISPDRQMMLFAKDMLQRQPGAHIVFDIKCSRHLRSLIEQQGGKPLMWKSGHSLIKSKMLEVDAPLAGELSGHIFFRERWYGFDDALYAGARMLEILAKHDDSPSEVFVDLPNALSTPEIKIPLPEEQHSEVMRELKANLAFRDAEINEIDGIRADFPYGWGVIRCSNTGPFLTARFEAEDDEYLAKIKDDFRTLLESTSGELAIPF
jgi:phosphomannomutase/phosphoglucomutase